MVCYFFFFSSRRRHTRCSRDWSSDVCSSDLQLARLRETIGWAVAHVAFHRERLGGVEVRRLDDLARLPFVRKTDLRDHYPFGLFAVEPGEIARIHASSGTKGKPTIVGYTAADLNVWREIGRASCRERV